MRHAFHGLLACAALALPLQAPAQAQVPASRGQLLYSTHCVECHTSQVHWRDKRQVRDWQTLKVWVRHWQGDARLQWTDEDVDAVALYLNAAIYRFPLPQAKN